MSLQTSALRVHVRHKGQKQKRFPISGRRRVRYYKSSEAVFAETEQASSPKPAVPVPVLQALMSPVEGASRNDGLSNLPVKSGSW